MGKKNGNQNIALLTPATHSCDRADARSRSRQTGCGERRLRRVPPSLATSSGYIARGHALSSSATTSSSDLPSVETVIASAAGMSFPTWRDRSRMSRSVCRWRTSSKSSFSPRPCRSRSPPARSFFRRSGEENLTFGVSKRHGALIPALGDKVTSCGDASLQIDQL